MRWVVASAAANMEGLIVFAWVAFVVSAVMAVLLSLLLFDLKMRRHEADSATHKYGRGFVAMLLVSLVCAQAHLNVLSRAHLFDEGSITCAVSVTFLTLTFSCIEAPLAGSMFILWRKVRRAQRAVADESKEGVRGIEAHQRSLWGRDARQVAAAELAVAVALAAAYIVVESTHEGVGYDCTADLVWRDVEQLGLRSSVASSALFWSLWAYVFLPLPFLVATTLYARSSGYLPLFGSRWLKISKLCTALGVTLFSSILTFSADAPAVRLVSSAIVVEGLTAYIVLLFANALSFPAALVPEGSRELRSSLLGEPELQRRASQRPTPP